MKKSLIALAALAASGVALAQSSVTLYGVVDTGLTYVNGNENAYGLTSPGGNVNSRLGFRGVEDLGNGLKATFQLEAGVNVDDGTGYLGKSGTGLEFRRIATVGLEGDFGAVRLGRELTASYMAVSRYDVFGDTGIGASRAWTGGYAARAENGIAYYTPNMSGFKVGVNYGFGEQVKARDNRYFGLGATYDNGPLSAGLGFDRVNNVGSDDLKTIHVGAAYNFGVAKVAGYYKRTKYSDIVTGNGPKFHAGGVGVSAPMGAGEVKASYDHYRLDKNTKANQLSVGYVHNLSKRTALYGTYAFLKNKNKGSAFTLGAGNIGATAGVKSNGAQHGLQAGIRHAF